MNVARSVSPSLVAATVLPLASALWACGDSTNEDMAPPPPPSPAAMADAGMMPMGPMCPPTGDEGARVAAVDFQYVGRGAAMKDVAYFVGSCLSGAECARREAEM